MTYRNDEEADLRRKVESLEDKLATAHNSLREAKAWEDRFKRTEQESRERAQQAELELQQIKVNGTSKEQLQKAMTTGLYGAMYSTGMASLATMFVFACAAMFSSCRGCSDSGVIVERNLTGVITDRYHYQQRTYTTCSGGGRTPRICTTHVIPEHWTVRVAHDGHEREVGMPRDDWGATQIGAPWCARPPCDPILVTEER